VLPVLLAARPAPAHNGAVAIAYPVPGIAIDGSLADWPVAVERYAIHRAGWGLTPSDEGDCGAWFRLACDVDMKSVLVALEVSDDSEVHCPDPGPLDWDRGDGCEIYLAEEEDPGASPVQYWVHSTRVGTLTRGVYSGLPPGCRVALGSNPGRRIYEWQIRLPEQAAATAPVGLAFDVAVMDRDRDGSFTSLSWGRGTGKTAHASDLGNLLVLPAAPSESQAARLRYESLDSDLVRVLRDARAGERVPMAVAAVSAAFSLLHLGLSLGDRRRGRHLAFSAACAALAAYTYLHAMAGSWDGGQHHQGWGAMALATALSGSMLVLASLLLLYYHFCERVPWPFWAFAAAVATLLAAKHALDAVGERNLLTPAWSLLLLACCVEAARVLFPAIRRRQPGARGFAALAAVYALAGLLPNLNALGLTTVALPSGVLPVAFLALVVAGSVWLVQSHSEQQRRAMLVEAEAERQGRELATARDLQRAMLPHAPPAVPGLAIAWLCRPTTEVAGDLYDSHVSSDGTLTLALGDATGHGMPAGVMVAAARGLLRRELDRGSPAQCLATMSGVIRSMHPGRFGLSMVLVRFQGRRLTVSAAGMPPLLIHGDRGHPPVEVLVPGPPLGLAERPVYGEQTLDLAPGEVLLLMSDGLPEGLSPAGEPFGYGRAVDAFAAVSHLAPEGICAALVQAAEQWAGGTPGDDCTFVAVRVQPSGDGAGSGG
jgi:hypothetical protein